MSGVSLWPCPGCPEGVRVALWRGQLQSKGHAKLAGGHRAQGLGCRALISAHSPCPGTFGPACRVAGTKVQGHRLVGAACQSSGCGGGGCVLHLRQVGVLGHAAWCLSPAWGPPGVATLTRLVTQIVLRRVLVLCGALGHAAWISCCVGPEGVWYGVPVMSEDPGSCSVTSPLCVGTLWCAAVTSPSEWDLGSYCMGLA